MSLDTLPAIGRCLLLGFLLSIALVGVSKGIAQHPSRLMQLYYRKASILVLLLVPPLVTLFGLEMPVYVEQAQGFSTETPLWITFALAGLWFLGVCWHVVRVLMQIRHLRQLIDADDGDTAMTREIRHRMQHWQIRLNLQPGPKMLLQGSERPWQASRALVFPAAARHWPVGQLDAALLLQLAQLKQSCWPWLVASHLAIACYWPLPWVARMFVNFEDALCERAVGLARAAYRDKEGWSRDVRKLRERLENLNRGAATVRLMGSIATLEKESSLVVTADLESVDPLTTKWQAARERRAARHFDPYERVYWLVAVASVVISVGTTLTIRQASPEFEPGFLNIRWQDQLGRRLTDTEAPLDTRPRRANPVRDEGDAQSSAP